MRVGPWGNSIGALLGKEPGILQVSVPHPPSHCGKATCRRRETAPTYKPRGESRERNLPVATP